MLDNPYRGFSIEVDGRRLPLRYTWDAIARIHARWPSGSYDLDKIDDLADMVAIGVHHYDDQMTGDKIRQASPPIIPAKEAVGRALWAAHWGTAKEFPQNPPKPGLVTRLKKLFELVQPLASSRVNSGA
jgi:hypothetical protein